MDRVAQNSNGEVLSKTWRDTAGNVVDPGTVTIGITRADGTVLVAPGTPTNGGGATARTFTLTTAYTGLLDTLKVVWTSSTYGARTPDYVEVVGGFLFTVADFRALSSAYANVTNYPTATITDMRITVEQSLEDACGVAFVPRYELETVDGVTSGLLLTKWPKVTAIRSVTVDDATVTAADVTALRYGALYYTGWAAGYANVTVGYEHGWASTPMRIKRAALILAKRWITPGAADDRAISQTTETGTYALFQAGVRGHLFDVPEVQAAVDQYNLTAGVA